MARLQGDEAPASGKPGFAGSRLPSPMPRGSKWTPRRAALIAAALIFVTPLVAGGQSAEVPNSAYAGGGGVLVQGNLKLSFTLGEPAAGPVSNGSTLVIGGFQATFLPPDDDNDDDGGRCTIFCHGFE